MNLAESIAFAFWAVVTVILSVVGILVVAVAWAGVTLWESLSWVSDWVRRKR